MKFVKLSIVALSLGVFVSSCGNSGADAAKATADSVARADSAAKAMQAAQPVTPPPVVADSAAKAADSAAKAAAPAQK